MKGSAFELKKILSKFIVAYLLTGAILGIWYIFTKAPFPWYLVRDSGKYSVWFNYLLKIFQPMLLWGPTVLADFVSGAGHLSTLMDSVLLIAFIMLTAFGLFKPARKAKKNRDMTDYQ